VRELLALLAALVGLPGPSAPAAAREPPVRLTVAASGDLLIHTPVAERALALGGGRRYEFAPLFAPVRRTIARADLALCHM
jgi:poly-gamma-glutamate synthesis protein (capsule biosynthesis protein)